MGREFLWYLGVLLYFFAGEGCTPVQRRGARTVIDLTDDACVLVRHVDPAVGEVCATADEIRPLLDRILAARAGGQP